MPMLLNLQWHHRITDSKQSEASIRRRAAAAIPVQYRRRAALCATACLTTESAGPGLRPEIAPLLVAGAISITVPLAIGVNGVCWQWRLSHCGVHLDPELNINMRHFPPRFPRLRASPRCVGIGNTLHASPGESASLAGFLRVKETIIPDMDPLCT
ncbi:hypothetical protein B0H10DRAFT_2185097 [Mycena sp. CBHHK59/15]|nr:hypothetical protein B0H10DRAFT_2185097 [Mycena sp. CBHHK59/15]